MTDKLAGLQQWIRPAEKIYIYIFLYRIDTHTCTYPHMCMCACVYISTHTYTHRHKRFYVCLACVVDKRSLSVFTSILHAVRSTRPLLPQCLGEISQLVMSNRLHA